MVLGLDIESLVRLFAFTVILLFMGLWEWLLPRRTDILRKSRWPANFGVFLINVAILILLPLSAVAAAQFAIEQKMGLFIWLQTPLWPAIIASLLILDCAIYWQHRIFHMINPLWKVHRMHHADTGFDVTTALRFHPIEIVISIIIKALIIILIGAPILAVIAFEILLNGSAMFNHSNVRMPRLLDRIVRWLVVTPDMHRIHHSTYRDEHSRNFGFCLSLWDRLFQSYAAQPIDGHQNMQIGLDIFNQAEEIRLGKLLSQPFR